MKKKATRIKAPVSERLGSFVARHGPGTAVKLGRLSKKAGGGIVTASANFKDGFLKGWEQV